MILIQDGSQNTNVDKPLRIIGDPYKVQVRWASFLSRSGCVLNPLCGERRQESDWLGCCPICPGGDLLRMV